MSRTDTSADYNKARLAVQLAGGNLDLLYYKEENAERLKNE